MSRCPPAERIHGRAVAVTAIEHGDIIVTVTSLVEQPGPLPCSLAKGSFVTTIFGGPLHGETWTGETWGTMLRDHAGAVSRVAELIALEQDGHLT